jgi:hypothetical protein
MTVGAVVARVRDLLLAMGKNTRESELTNRVRLKAFVVQSVRPLEGRKR